MFGPKIGLWRAGVWLPRLWPNSTKIRPLQREKAKWMTSTSYYHNPDWQLIHRSHHHHQLQRITKMEETAEKLRRLLKESSVFLSKETCCLSWTRYSSQPSWCIPPWTTTGLWSRGQRPQVISPVWICLFCRRNSSLSSVNLWINSERKVPMAIAVKKIGNIEMVHSDHYPGLLTVVNLHRRKSNRLLKGASSRPLSTWTIPGLADWRLSWSTCCSPSTVIFMADSGICDIMFKDISGSNNRDVHIVRMEYDATLVQLQLHLNV